MTGLPVLSVRGLRKSFGAMTAVDGRYAVVMANVAS